MVFAFKGCFNNENFPIDGKLGRCIDTKTKTVTDIEKKFPQKTTRHFQLKLKVHT